MPVGNILGLSCMTMEGLVPIDQGFVEEVPDEGYCST
jgi:hypothetical protein